MIRLAFRTLLSMNLLQIGGKQTKEELGVSVELGSWMLENERQYTHQVVWSELSRMVRSPLAALCSLRLKPSVKT